MAYQSPHVRHLAWCLFSEPMAQVPNVQALTIEPSPEIQQWLKQLDENPQPLIEYLARNNARLLGSYFECLWQFFFQNAPDWQLLAHHFQVFEGKQTLGELDILARTAQQDWHIELAVKFYLLPKANNGQTLKDWIGPQSHDRLDKKINKFVEKQLPFLHHDQTELFLQQHQLPSDFQQAVALKGYLFVHIFDTPLPFHPNINPNVEMGKWLHASETHQLFEKDFNWVVLPKLDWLGGYDVKQNDLPILDSQASSHYIQNHFTASPYPYALMLVKLDETQQHEVERFLVVHDQWPTPVKKPKKIN